MRWPVRPATVTRWRSRCAVFDELVAAHLEQLEQLRHERDAATRELAERYEEISLLYAIGELLGSGSTVEETGRVILRELLVTVGAARGALLLHDAATTPRALSTIVASHGLSDTEARALTGAPPDALTLNVPIRRVAAEPGVTLGAMLLVREAGSDPFTASDRKLVAAVAVQAGTALHNARLTRDMMAQRALQRELQVAQELQQKLLPSPAVIAPDAEAGAAVRAAVNVGGDFYALLRLDDQRTGVVIGDVSGHGVHSALVMALALSATGIHLQSLRDPSLALAALQESVWDELRSTDMSLALCMVVIDVVSHEVRFANAGHPHAFVVRPGAEPVRMGAQSPALGLVRSTWHNGVVPWDAQSRLLLFTDGIVDARNSAGVRMGEEAVLQAAMTHAPPQAVVQRVFAGVDAWTGGEPGNDDLAIVVVDRPPRAAPAAEHGRMAASA